MISLLKAAGFAVTRAENLPGKPNEAVNDPYLAPRPVSFAYDRPAGWRKG